MVARRKNLIEFNNRYARREIKFQVASTPVPVARIDDDRWVIDCPFCNGAELGDPDAPYFFCLSCQMAQCGGKYLNVKYPNNVKAIEAAVNALPADQKRNWRP